MLNIVLFVSFCNNRAVTFAVRPGVLAATLGDTAVLFSRGDRRLHVLNHAAAAVWGLVEDGGFERAAMVEHLSGSFGIDATTMGVDVDSALALLTDHGLIEAGRTDPVPDGSRPAPPPAIPRPIEGPTFAAINARVGLAVDDADLQTRLQALLSPLEVDAAPTESIEIEAGRIQVGSTGSYQLSGMDHAVTAVVAEINAAAVRSCRVEPVMHAAALADESGAVLLAAPADHGKSTLALAMVEAGWTYLTDEAAAIDDDGRVRPYPKRIALDEGAFDLFPRTDPAVNPSTIEVEGPYRYVAVEQSASAPVPVKAVWLPKWTADSELEIERLGPVDALHKLLENSFDFAGDDHEAAIAFGRLCELAVAVPVVRIEFGVTADALGAIRSDVGSQLAPIGVFLDEVDDGQPLA